MGSAADACPQEIGILLIETHNDRPEPCEEMLPDRFPDIQPQRQNTPCGRAAKPLRALQISSSRKYSAGSLSAQFSAYRLSHYSIAADYQYVVFHRFLSPRMFASLILAQIENCNNNYFQSYAWTKNSPSHKSGIFIIKRGVTLRKAASL
jgi:hypothetical protein